MAPHSSTLAWKIPRTEEPGKLWFMGSLRVGHDWATSFSLFTFMHWRRKWQPTPLFLPGESQGRGSRWAASMGSHRVGHDRSDLAAAAGGPRTTSLMESLTMNHLFLWHTFGSQTIHPVFQKLQDSRRNLGKTSLKMLPSLRHTCYHLCKSADPNNFK